MKKKGFTPVSGIINNLFVPFIALVFALVSKTLLFPPLLKADNALTSQSLKFEAVYKMQARILQTFQDDNGFIWSCGQGGLARWDGQKLVNYTPGSVALSNSNIYKIVQDNSSPDVLWIATQGGINRLNLKTGTTAVYKQDPNSPESLTDSAIQDIVQDKNESDILWVATVHGLNRFEKSSGRCNRYFHDKNDSNSLIYNRLWRLLDDRFDPTVLWIVPFKGGFQRLDKTTNKFTTITPDPKRFHVPGIEHSIMSAVVQDRDYQNILWVGSTKHGLFKFNKSAGEFIAHYPTGNEAGRGLRDGPLLFLHDDGRGHLWIGGMVEESGLSIFDKQTRTFTQYWHTPSDRQSLPDNFVSHVFEDNAGIVWISSFTGNVSKLDMNVKSLDWYANIPGKQGSLLGQSIKVVHLSGRNNVWIATEKGLSRFLPGTGKFINYKNNQADPGKLGKNTITGILEDEQGNVWVSTLLGPLLLFDPNHGVVKERINPQVESLMSITQDPVNADIFWMGTRMGGMARFDRITREFKYYRPVAITPTKGPSMEFVDSIIHDQDREHIWIGSWHGGGLNKFNKSTEQFTHYLHDPNNDDSLSTNAIATIYQDNSGRVWIGTQGGGLNKYLSESNSFERYGSQYSIPSYVESIVEDDVGRLWLGTDKGVVAFDPERERVDSTLHVSDAIQGSHFRSNGGFKTADGTIWLGAVDRVYSFHPQRLVKNSRKPSVHFTSFTQGGIPLDLANSAEYTREIVLDWHNNYFEFEFVSLNYSQPERNRYQYLMQGVDQDWFYSGGKNFGRYTNLPDGKFLLKIKGSNNSGVWSTEKSVVISVIPPFWRTNWFYLFSAALSVIAVGSVALYLVRLRKEIHSRLKAEKAVQESETLLRTVIDTIPDLIWLKSPLGAYLTCNRKFELFSGLKESEIIGKTDYDFIDSALADHFLIKDRAAIDKGGPSVNEEEVNYATDGHREILETIRTPMYNASHDLIGVLGIARDISKLKYSEIEIRREKEITETALNTQKDTFFLFDPATGTAIRWNKAFNEITGYDDDEIKGLKAPESYYSTEDQQKATAFIKSIEKTGFGTIELDLICKDGHKVPTEYNVAAIPNSVGKIKYLVSVGRDLTERKQFEMRFLQLAQSSSDWIWEFDENTIFTYSSPGVCRLLGYTPEEIVGKSAFDLVPSQERERVAKEFEQSRGDHKPFNRLENINQHKNGHLVTIESSGTPIFDSDGVFRGYRGIDRDITERKRMEDELRQAHKMESIGTLAGGIAHDFNNILSIIIGNAELATSDLPQWSPAFENIEEIKIASLRAKEVVRQLLSFSRKSEQRQTPLDLSTLVKESIKLIRSSTPSTIEIIENIAHPTDTILADATQIHQVLINLCTNAAHAMAETGGILTISLQSLVISEQTPSKYMVDYGRYLELRIQDSGVGIVPEVLNKIFDPYFTTKEVGKGTGMGLAVVMGIVRNHNAEIFVNSAPGEGSEFVILFPTTSAQAETESTVEKKEIYSTKGETILFVDDEESIVEIAENVLTKLRYKVMSSSSSIDALAMFTQDPNRFDLVITDMTMPQMHGLELLGQLKQQRPDIPVIICTGHSDKLSKLDLEREGIAAIAMKPITMAEIGELIRVVLKRGIDDISST